MSLTAFDDPAGAVAASPRGARASQRSRAALERSASNDDEACGAMSSSNRLHVSPYPGGVMAAAPDSAASARLISAFAFTTADSANRASSMEIVFEANNFDDRSRFVLASA